MTCLPPPPTPDFFKWRNTNANTGEGEVEKFYFPLTFPLAPAYYHRIMN